MNFAAKVVSEGHYTKRDHVSPLNKELQWLRVNNTIKLNTAVFMHKALKTASHPNNLKFAQRKQRNSRNIRNGHLLDIPAVEWNLVNDPY